MIIKTDFKAKTTLFAIFALIFIATACRNESAHCIDIEDDETSNGNVFVETPQNKEIALYAENETLSAKIIPDGDGEVTFVWYRKNSGEADFPRLPAPSRSASCLHRQKKMYSCCRKTITLSLNIIAWQR